MTGLEGWRGSAVGRLLEITNCCIVEAKHGNPGAERRAAFGKLDEQVWVGVFFADTL